MRAVWVLLFAGCSGSSVRAPAPATLAQAAQPGLHAIDPARFEATTRYLSADDLEGRGTGSTGGHRSEDYIAAQLAAIGLAPHGDNGTFFQTVALREATRVDAASSHVFHALGGD